MNKNKDILLDILEKNWEPEQIYNMFPNPSPWKNEIEQEKTGYCWLITELHALMYFMSKKYGTKDIYFSLTDLIVFDKVEKANCFFEKVYKTRRLPTTNEEVTYILTNAMSDRGHWEMSVNLIKKYGLVPIEKKECEKNNLRTGEINAVLAFLMRYYASIIRDREKVKKINDFLQIKEIAMKKIKEILYTYIKKPKEKIQIPAYIKKKEKSWISPKEFYDRYVCFPFDDYACFFVGANEQDSVIKVSLKSLGNIYENGSLTFWKISSDVMYNGIYKQLQQGDTCWIGLDGGKFLFRDSGIYDDSVFNIKQLEKLGTLVVMGWYYIIGLAVTAPFFWKYIAHTQFLKLPLQAQAELAYILILGTVLPMYLLYRGTEKLTSVHTALYRYIQPVVAGILAIVRGQAVFDTANVVALIFIFAGVSEVNLC